VFKGCVFICDIINTATIGNSPGATREQSGTSEIIADNSSGSGQASSFTLQTNRDLINEGGIS